MAMLYLVRHGAALDRAQDPQRPLSREGRTAVARVAALLRRAGVHVDQIIHSGKRRAEETAAILAEALQPPGGVLGWPGLAPNGDERAVAQRIEQEGGPLMLVGHLSSLERLTGLLVVGDPDVSVVRLQTGTAVCLEWAANSQKWTVAWAVTPDLAQ